MVRILTLIFLGFSAIQSHSQDLSFRPEVLVGNRSVMFQHQLDFQLKKNISFNNYLLVDNEYNRTKNRIYFIRNMVSYNHSNKWRSNLAFGLKNPGLFSTISWTYRQTDSKKYFIYTFGLTYQKELSLEQSLVLRKNLVEFKSYILQFQLLVVASLDRNGYSRGIQQFRFAIQRQNLQFGVGINLDQLNNATTVLCNYGVFLKLKLQNKF